MNRKDRKRLEVILDREKRSILQNLNEDTEKLWQQAYDNTQWLTGKRVKIGGKKIDFSHFDFIVGATIWTPEDKVSDLKLLQKFWITLFPYIDKIINQLHYYNVKFEEVYEIEAVTLKKFALQNLELQCRQKFMQDRLAPEIEEQFKIYHKEFKEESDAEIERIKEREKETKAKQEKWQEEKAKSAKKKKRLSRLREKRARP